jgi:hypothetical protein
MKLYPILLRALSYALPALAGVTIIAAIAYVNDQQTWRMAANEPQEWIAQSAVNTSAQESVVNVPVLAPTPEDVAPISRPVEKIVIERDEAPYTILYDAKRNAVSGTGYLHGVLPQLPSGIFDAALKNGVNRITWQPEPGVRQAILIIPIKSGPLAGGFAVAGRSLAYTEWQEAQLMQRWILGWLAAAIGILFISACMAFLALRRSAVAY